MITLLIISIVINIISVTLFIFSYIRENIYIKIINSADSTIFYSYKTIQNCVSKMNEIDMRGAFKSDDEVGSVFTQLNLLVKTLKNDLEIKIYGRNNTNE